MPKALQGCYFNTLLSPRRIERAEILYDAPEGNFLPFFCLSPHCKSQPFDGSLHQDIPSFYRCSMALLDFVPRTALIKFGPVTCRETIRPVRLYDSEGKTTSRHCTKVATLNISTTAIRVVKYGSAAVADMSFGRRPRQGSLTSTLSTSVAYCL